MCRPRCWWKILHSDGTAASQTETNGRSTLCSGHRHVLCPFNSGRSYGQSFTLVAQDCRALPDCGGLLYGRGRCRSILSNSSNSRRDFWLSEGSVHVLYRWRCIFCQFLDLESRRWCRRGRTSGARRLGIRLGRRCSFGCPM